MEEELAPNNILNCRVSYQRKKCYSRTLNNVIVVTHEMALGREVSDLDVFLDDGRIVVCGKPDEVLVNPTHERLHAFLSRFEEARRRAPA